jgi:GT2 family glycosyltransferase
LPGESSIHPTKIFAVVVLYRQRPSASVTVATLARALRETAAVDCHGLIYDNSPSGESAINELPENFRYHAAARNRGLLGAYEAALEGARAEGCEWLLTLDQDTALPADFFSALQPGLQAAADDLHIGVRIAAIVPHLAEGERLLSPAYVGIGRARPLPANFAGVPESEVRAFNSAALLRTEALDAIGGFDPCFWLDHLDSWLHHQFYVHGWRMYVLGSVHLQHHFSLLNYKERISPERFRNFLAAEGAYVDLYGSWWARAAYTAQLGVRLVNQQRRREAREIRRATRAAWVGRLTMARAKRLSRWRHEAGCGVQR